MRTLLCTCLLLAAMSPRAQVGLLVVDEAGDPVVGATVRLELPDAPDSATVYAVSGLDGAAVVAPSVRAPHRLVVTYVGYAAYRREFEELTPGRPLDLGRVALAADVAVLAEAQAVAVRARGDDPFAFTDVAGDELAVANVGQDIPMLLRRVPGATFTSDAGTGVGYTGLRIRGADATRINVTVNGVPLNDAESQGVFWVNMPDFVSSTSSLQVQRGVGQSTYGTGAFGANLNLVTEVPTSAPAVVGELAGGSYGTGRAMLKASTGDLGPFSAIGRVSYIASEGFVDRASARLGSAYLGTDWDLGDRQRLQLIGWTGDERTYQSWFGVPRSFLGDDDLITFNPAGQITDSTFYDDQVDDYGQTHAQALYSLQLDGGWLLQATGHYTRGRGFFEVYERGVAADLALPPDVEGDLPVASAQRLWLDNHFYGGIVTLSREAGAGEGGLADRLTTVFSAGANEYRGGHFGRVHDVLEPDLDAALLDDRLYDNDAVKRSANAFAKAAYDLTDAWRVYGDLQVRHVRYAFEGLTRDLRTLPAEVDFTFVNPKAGVTWTGPGGQQAFASFALGQREPNRNDFRESPVGAAPDPERLLDYELGYRAAPDARFALEANAYWMRFRDQLVATGRLNDVGEAVRQNVPASYRVGLEVAAAYAVAPAWTVEGNVSASRSRIERFDEFVYDFTGEAAEVIERVDVPTGFSPDLITNLGLRYRGALAGGVLDVALWGNTVSRQFLDNSGADAVVLPAYERLDLEARYTFAPAGGREVTCSLQLQNVLDANPATNGYSYRYLSPGADATTFDPYVVREDGDRFVGVGVYPQAGIMALAGLRLALTRG